MVGSTVSHYKILEDLGGGGMSRVYRGVDLRLEREVVLKFLPSDQSADLESRERMIREAKAGFVVRSPAHLHGLRHRRDGQRPAVHRHGLLPRRDRRTASPARPAGARRSRAHRVRRPLRPRRRARQGDRPPRHQAGQPDVARRRRRQDPRTSVSPSSRTSRASRRRAPRWAPSPTSLPSSSKAR